MATKKSEDLYTCHALLLYGEDKMLFNYSRIPGRQHDSEYFSGFDYLAGSNNHPCQRSQLKKSNFSNTSDPESSTLEKIASIDSDDFVTGLISDKSKFAKAGVKTLQSLIYDRKHIRDKNFTLIDYDICHARTLMHELDVWGYKGNFDRQRQTLHMALFGLERERRAEDVSYWRDVSLLKRDFITAVADYVSAARRGMLFKNGDR